MSLTQQLAATVCVLVLMYFGTAVFFVSQSHARVHASVNPAMTSAVQVRDHQTTEDPPGHFRLVVKRDPQILSVAQWRLLTATLKKDLQRRFGAVQVVSFGDLAKNDRLGSFYVEVDAWKERPYWGPRGSGSRETRLPTYMSIKMDVKSSIGVAWSGGHHLNAIRSAPDIDSHLSYQHAHDLQVRELVNSMLDQMPTVRHFLPTSD
jgi:hypothetical protein